MIYLSHCFNKITDTEDMDFYTDPDASMGPDASTSSDASTNPDASTDPDAFTDPDASVNPDASTDPDASINSDACTNLDASGPDAYTDPDADRDLDAQTDTDTNTDSSDSDCSIEITAFAHDLAYDNDILHEEPIMHKKHHDSVDSDVSDSDASVNLSGIPLPEPDYDSDLDINAEFFNTPEVLNNWRDQLLGGYKPPDQCPQDIKTGMDIDKLSLDEKISLEHYISWKKSNGTIQAYTMHAKVLATHTQATILSLYQARQLAIKLTGFHATKVDMCPKSCIAYTGDYEHLDKCPYKSSAGPICNTPRYRKSSKGIKKPIAQVEILPIMDTVRALYANAETSSEM